MRTIGFVLFLLVVSGLQNLFAGGEELNVRGMGMARSFVSSSKGLDAVGINPANLAMKDDAFTLSLAPVAVHAGSDFLTLGLYNEYFTGVESDGSRVGKYLEDSDKQHILGAFRNGVGEISFDAAVRLLGVSFQIESMGGFAFTITDELAGNVRIPDDYARFALYGNTPGSVFDFSRTSAKASWLREYALSFGGTIPHPSFMEWLSLGASVKLVQGYGYYDVKQFNTSLTTSEDGILTGKVNYLSVLAGIDPTKKGSEFSVAPFGMPVYGNGTGFDIGFAGGIRDYMTVGLSMTDIGKVNWDTRIEETFADTTLVVDDPQSVSDGSVIENSLKGKKREGAPFSTSLPTTFRVGVAVQVDKVIGWLPGEMLVEANYNKGVTDAPGSTLYGRFSVGMEWKLLKFLPLRSGVSFGGVDRLNYALGFGIKLGFFDLDVATENMELFWSGDNISHASFAVGTRFRF